MAMGGTPLQRLACWGPSPSLGKAADSKPIPILRDGDKPQLATGEGDQIMCSWENEAGNTRLLRCNTQFPGGLDRSAS